MLFIVYVQPLYGLIKAKLELITHAYFDERDFSKVELLEQTFNNLNTSLADSLFSGAQMFLGKDTYIQKYSAAPSNEKLICFNFL